MKRALVLSGGGSKGKLCTIDKTIFFRMHWEQQISLTNIAKSFSVTRMAIAYYFKKYNIPIRRSKEATKLAISGEQNPAKRQEVLIKLSGENNHFFGKKHSAESRKKMSDGQAKWDRKEWTKVRWTDERKRSFSVNNPMFVPEIMVKHRQALLNNRHKFSGTNSPRWKGGISNLYNRIRNLSEYKNWRMNIYKRDGKICNFCGDKNVKYNIDHIKPFALIIKENNITSVGGASKCEDLWDINNGRVLCIKCHIGTETFGNKS